MYIKITVSLSGGHKESNELNERPKSEPLFCDYGKISLNEWNIFEKKS
jgi:hypothetical protein